MKYTQILLRQTTPQVQYLINSQATEIRVFAKRNVKSNCRILFNVTPVYNQTGRDAMLGKMPCSERCRTCFISKL